MPGQGVVVDLADLLTMRAEAQRLSLGGPDVVRGLFPGLYRSLFRGRGLDFEEVRAYQWGDDYRMLDWRVTARSGRLHTKIFREEREHTLFLTLDAGPSMRFGSRRAFKWVAAARAAAVVAWLAADNGDRIGGLVFGDGPVPREQRALMGRTGAMNLFRLLERVGPHPAPGGGMAEALPRLGRLAKPGGLVLLVSDFADLDAAAEDRLAALVERHEVAALFVWDPLEADLPPPGRYGFSDGDRILTLDTGAEDLRAAFREAFAERRGRAEAVCRRLHIRFAPLPTDRPTAEALRDGLFRLAALAKGRSRHA
jgi:uncharacterized protein (DUF58 family)